jgi:hypothetical protein
LRLNLFETSSPRRDADVPRDSLRALFGNVNHAVTLVDGSKKTWRRLDRQNMLPKIVADVSFKDGMEVSATDAKRRRLIQEQIAKIRR